jgi:hypothetical protein
MRQKKQAGYDAQQAVKLRREARRIAETCHGSHPLSASPRRADYGAESARQATLSRLGVRGSVEEGKFAS